MKLSLNLKTSGTRFRDSRVSGKPTNTTDFPGDLASGSLGDVDQSTLLAGSTDDPRIISEQGRNWLDNIKSGHAGLQEGDATSLSLSAAHPVLISVGVHICPPQDAMRGTPILAPNPNFVPRVETSLASASTLCETSFGDRLMNNSDPCRDKRQWGLQNAFVPEIRSFCPTIHPAFASITRTQEDRSAPIFSASSGPACNGNLSDVEEGEELPIPGKTESLI